MRALVVYESMYGNTHAIACNVADGLRADYQVTLVPVGQASPELVAAADLLIVGGPTHMHGLSSASSRRTAAQTAAKQGSELTMDPDAGGPGLRDWLKGIGPAQPLAAAFDTRLGGAPAFTGRASRGIARLLRQRGGRLIVAPESFLVDKHNTLVDGESSRAWRWGSAVAAAASSTRLAARG